MTYRPIIPAYLSNATNFHLVSDTHCDPNQTSYARAIKVANDCARMVGRYDIDATLVMGDLMNSPMRANADLWVAWRNAMPFNVWPVLGNHDIFNPNKPAATDQRWNSTDAAAILGLPAANYIVDDYAVRLIFLAPRDDNHTCRWPLTLGPIELSFLDESLASTDKPCIVIFHAPLGETVGGIEDGIGYSSWEGWVKANSNPDGGDKELREILAAHPNVLAWLSGHTHSPLSAPGIITTVDVGSHKLAHINGSSTWYVGRNAGSPKPHDPLMGMLMSVLDERTIEVRFRDHGNGVWSAPLGGEYQGRKVVTLKV